MEFLRRHWGKIMASVLLAIVGVIFGVIPYFCLSKLIGSILESSRELSIYIYLIGLIFLGFLGSVLFNALSTIISHRLAFGIIQDQRKELADKLSKLSMGEVEKRSSGRWARFMVEGLYKLEGPIAHVIPEVIANLLVSIGLVAIIFALDWRIGLANLLTIPLGILFSLLMMSGYEEKSRRYQEASKNMHSSMVEYVHAIKLIKAFDKTASSYEKFRESVAENKNAMLEWYLSVCFPMTAAMETFPATMIFVLPTSLFLYMKGTLEISTAILCILLAFAAYKPIIKVMSHMDTMANIRVTFDEIRQIMNLENLQRGHEIQEVKNYDIEFRGVDFSYDSDKKVLDGLSFTAKENELTAIVGSSGGGKSTVARLIAGFWNIDKGEILLGGASIKDMPLEQNMQLITYVSQENHLFNKSIRENLILAKEDASQDEIEEACKKASIHDFILSLPKGYDTLVGEGGASLSGGEIQRLSIARAFLKDSPIILLDEATAYADPDNQAVIQEAISKLVKDKTVIMIAHRLSTVMGANKILVLEDGKIIEEGRHEELLRAQGRYSRMWETYKMAQGIEVI